MHIFEMTLDRFPAWRRMREELHPGLDAAFHEQEMALSMYPQLRVTQRRDLEHKEAI